MQKNTLSSSVYGIFYRINHILGHKSSLSKFKKIETVSRIFSDLNALRLDINYKEKKKKLQKHRLMEIKQYITK